MFPPLRTLWKYYPNKKGLCTGILSGAFGTSSMIFNKISNTIINPKHEGLDPSTQFYSKEIGLQVPYYYLYTSIIIISIGLFTVLFLFPYEEQDANKKTYSIKKIYVNKYLHNFIFI